jgi:hypothetical protein
LAAVATGQLVALRSEATTLPGPAMGLRAAAGRLPLLVAPATAHLNGGDGALSRLELGGSDPLELAAAWQQALQLEQAEADELAGRTWLSPAEVPALAAGLADGGMAGPRRDQHRRAPAGSGWRRPSIACGSRCRRGRRAWPTGACPR